MQQEQEEAGEADGKKERQFGDSGQHAENRRTDPRSPSSSSYQHVGEVEEEQRQRFAKAIGAGVAAEEKDERLRTIKNQSPPGGAFAKVLAGQPVEWPETEGEEHE